MLEEYFAKIDLGLDYSNSQIGSSISFNQDTFPNLEGVKIALFGKLDKNNLTSNCDTIRKAFYQLADTKTSVKIADLGNIKQGATPKDTAEAITDICCTLLSRSIIPLYIGGSIDDSEAFYKAFQKNENAVEISLISDKIPITEYEILHRVCTAAPNVLKLINTLGFQAQYIPTASLETLEILKFNHLRLGEIKQNIENAEVYLRNSEFAIFDINAIQHSDAPGKKTVQPSGLTSEEACQLARYLGIAEENKALAVTGFEYTLDHRDLTANLCAHIIWYYLDGYQNRSNDSPKGHSEFLKYRCDFSSKEDPILFLKSKRTQRWWMQIEHPASPEDSSKKLSFPCTYEDYQIAASGETPQRYLDALKKLA